MLKCLGLLARPELHWTRPQQEGWRTCLVVFAQRTHRWLRAIVARLISPRQDETSRL